MDKPTLHLITNGEEEKGNIYFDELVRNTWFCEGYVSPLSYTSSLC